MNFLNLYKTGHKENFITTLATISFKDREYGTSSAGEVEIKVEQPLETVSFSYDGGRRSVCIN